MPDTFCCRASGQPDKGRVYSVGASARRRSPRSDGVHVPPVRNTRRQRMFDCLVRICAQPSERYVPGSAELLLRQHRQVLCGLPHHPNHYRCCECPAGLHDARAHSDTRSVDGSLRVRNGLHHGRQDCVGVLGRSSVSCAGTLHDSPLGNAGVQEVVREVRPPQRVHSGECSRCPGGEGVCSRGLREGQVRTCG